MFLRKASWVPVLILMQLCISGSTFAQNRATQPPPFGDKHVGGDVPIDERLTKRGGKNQRVIPAEDRVVTKGWLAPSREDRAAFAAFLQMPGTGLIRLFPFEKVLFRPGPTDVASSGAFYSFTNLTHSVSYGSDIGLSQDQLSVGFVTGYGFLTNLGDVPLENVSLSDPRAGFIASYKPANTFLQARAETRRFQQPVSIEGNSYQTALPVELNSTYLVRSINYGQPIFGPKNYLRLSVKLPQTDVLVAFKIIRKDADKTLTIAWKLLKKYPDPKLD